MLRGMNSGLYFQTNKVLLFGEVLILKPKEKNKKKTSFCLNLLLWYNTKVWKDFVLVLLLCRQFLVVERTVILFSYRMKCLVWMLFIWGDILYMAYFQSTSVFSHTICFKVDTEVSLYKCLALVFLTIKRWVNVSILFFFPPVCLCHYIDVTLFLPAFHYT